MSITIALPNDLNFPNSIDFCELLKNLPDDDRYAFDFGNIGNVTPFGMLLIVSHLRSFIKMKRKNATFYGLNYKNNSYAAHMGFYKSIGLDHGKAPGEARGSDTYLPITKIKVSDIRDESITKLEHVVDTIERKAAEISKVLSRGNDKLNKILIYSIREIMRNVVEHSESDSIWFAGQYWPTKDRIEISIMDEGIGIPQSLKYNKKLSFTEDEEALLLAIEPAISGKDIRLERKRDSFYGNSGYGLYMTSRICQDGGDFLVGSSSKILGVSGPNTKMFDFTHQGTIIRMRLQESKIKDLEDLLSKYRAEGVERAKQHRKSDVLTASKSSRVLINPK